GSGLQASGAKTTMPAQCRLCSQLRNYHSTAANVAMCLSATSYPILFDHLVGNAEQPGREGKAERLGGLHVDHQLELSRLLDRQLSHLGAPEDAVNVVRRLSALFGEIAAIGDQTT